ncbi:hypothetical protein IFM89_009333, partial [Coptis chinensis]
MWQSKVFRRHCLILQVKRKGRPSGKRIKSWADKGPVRKNNDNSNKPTTRQQKPDKRARVQATDKHASNEIDYETQMSQARSVTGHSLHPYNVNPTYGFQPPFLNQGYFMPTDQQSLH